MLNGAGCLSLQCHSLSHPTSQPLKLLRLQTPPKLPPPNETFPLCIPEKCLHSFDPAQLLPIQKTALTPSLASHSFPRTYFFRISSPDVLLLCEGQFEFGFLST